MGVQFRRGGFDGESASMGHGVLSVDGEIQDHLFNLSEREGC